MDYDTVVDSAVRHFSRAQEFQTLFPNAEHTIVEAKRHFEPEGWQPVNEWISRTHLHDRYVVWLVVAIEIEADGTISEIEEPELYVVEVHKVRKHKGERGGALWEAGFLQFDEGDWDRLVESGGDFAALEFDMTTDAPVDRFAACWRDTRPHRRPPPPDSIALKAPFRFMTSSG